MNRWAAAERRGCPRGTASACAWIQAARIRPGRDVRLLNLSEGGALVEGPIRLLPGALVDLQLWEAETRHEVRSRVLRSAVRALDHGGRVYYRVALCFERAFAEGGRRVG